MHVNKMDQNIDSNIQDLCRLCLQFCPEGVDIFQRQENGDKYDVIIQEILQIELIFQDQWPVLACPVCIESIEGIRQYKSRVIAAQEQLKDLPNRFIKDINIQSTGSKDSIEEHSEEVECQEEIKIAHQVSEDATRRSPVFRSHKSLYEHRSAVHDISSITDDPSSEVDEEKVYEIVETVEEQEIEEITETSEDTPSNNSITPAHPPDVLQCEACPKMFSSRRVLNQHRGRMHKLPPAGPKKILQCEVCEKVFKSSEGLKMHRRLHIPKEERELRICDVCGKGFETSVMLFQHRQKHNMTRTEECPVCKGQFFDLKRHIRTNHTKVRTLQECEICGEKTINMKCHIYNRHRPVTEVHTCEHCGKEFNKRTGLKKHLMIHLGIKVKCLFCPHESTNDSNQTMHMRTQHKEEYERYKENKKRTPKVRDTLNLNDLKPVPVETEII